MSAEMQYGWGLFLSCDGCEEETGMMLKGERPVHPTIDGAKSAGMSALDAEILAGAAFPERLTMVVFDADGAPQMSAKARRLTGWN